MIFWRGAGALLGTSVAIAMVDDFVQDAGGHTSPARGVLRRSAYRRTGAVQCTFRFDGGRHV